MTHLSAQPAMTIVVVTYGARAWTERSLAAVRANTDVPFQLLVVDNASPDGTGDWLRTVLAPDELLALDDNIGFAAGNDLALNRAIAPAVCLLNSDAIVPPGWASTLLAPLADARIAATVPLYVDPDGVVQEAGCNVADDAIITPLGRGDDPDSSSGSSTTDVSSEHQWPRTVQHASAACLVVRTRSLRAVGGLDAGYGLAYYEDVELVAALQARGESVLLVPSVRVVHAHAASTPDRSAADARVAANRPRFVARHRTYLAWRHHAFDLVREPHRYYAARDFEAPDRDLVVVAAPPDSVHDLPTAPGATRRVTVVVTAPADARARGRAETLRAAGVEVLLAAGGIDPVAVLHERFLQLSRVHASRAWLDDHADVVRDTQLQAELVAV
jgi:GT2 family glycosyltransferase